MKIAQYTNPGGREENQDAMGISRWGAWICACVCDGLGGHRGGAVAAKRACEAALAAQGGPDIRMEAASNAVLAAQKEESLPSMRTTAVLLMCDGENARWAHCGDSRLYRLRDGEVSQLTLDHSVPQALVRQGEIEQWEIRGHEDRARLTRALGQGEEVRWDEGEDYCLPGDVYLLLSDGFWEPVVEKEMQAQLCEDPQQYLEALAEIVEACPDREHDNYTAIAVYV